MHDSVIVPKSFQWKRGPEGAEEILSDNGDTLTIMHSNTNAVTSSSVLTVTENIPGSYRFVCTATLQFSEAQDTIFVSNSASVLVKGKLMLSLHSLIATFQGIVHITILYESLLSSMLAHYHTINFCTIQDRKIL